MSAILVVASARKPTLELVTIARRLGEPVVAVFGALDDETAELFRLHGATKVYVAAGPQLNDYVVLPKVDAVSEVVRRAAPAAVLVSSNVEGKEIAARLAVRLDSGIITDAVDVQATPGGIVAAQSVFAGTWRVRGMVRRGLPIITVRPNSTAPEPVDDAAPPEIECVPLNFDGTINAARVVSRWPRVSSGRPDLAEAAVVVTGGRGVGSAEAFDVIEQLADALDAAVGATRAAVDLGWRPHELQIGQTGKTVAPQLYFACGVSGAIQHLAGMQSSRTVVAINKDPQAPIFAIADFGVIGDLHAVIPALVKELEQRKG